MRSSYFLLVAILSSGALALTEHLPPGLKVVGRVLEECLGREEGATECVESSASEAVSRALAQETLNLMPGLSLTRTSPDPPRPRALSPPSLWDNLHRFLATRSLNINLADIEGRGKKKKRLVEYILVAGLTMAAFLIPLKLKVIAAMAASALFIGKIALVLAGLAGLKKLVSQPHEETTHVHYDNHRNDLAAHYLAYGAHAS